MTFFIVEVYYLLRRGGRYISLYSKRGKAYNPSYCVPTHVVDSILLIIVGEERTYNHRYSVPSYMENAITQIIVERE